MAHEEAPPADAGAPAAPKSKMPLIAAIIAGIAVGAGSGVVLVGPMFAKKFAAQHATAAADTSAEGAAAAEGGHESKPAEGGKEEGGKGGAAAAPPVLTLENLVLNPTGSGGAHYLLMTIAIECKDQKGVESLTLRDAELKDLILTVLGKKTVDQLSDIAFRDQIKTELIAALTDRFGKTSVKQLYFPQFVIQ